MIDTKTYANLTMLGLRWMARVGSLLSIGLIALFFVGFQPKQVRPKEWIGLAFFPLGVVVGMTIAWWKEDIGAGISLVSLLAFYGVYGFLLGSPIHGWAFIVFTSPAFLFLLHSIISRSKLTEATS
jgi:hypothetical protein